MRGKFLKSFLLTILTVICTAVCSGCQLFGLTIAVGAILIDDAINDPNKAFELVGDPTISCLFDEETQTYSVVIDGVIKNTSEDEWSLTLIDFVLYDEDNNVVGTAYCYCGVEVLPLETYRFYVSEETTQEVTSVKLYEVSGSHQV